MPDEPEKTEIKKEELPEEAPPKTNLTFVLEVRQILVTMPSTILHTKDTPNVLAFKGKLECHKKLNF